MKTLLVTTESDAQTDLLIRLAEELHLKFEIVDAGDAEKKALLKLAESSFAKEWNSKEDERWDLYLKTAGNV